MHQKKSKRILIYFFLFLMFGSINNIELNNIKFSKIQKINLSGLNNFNNQLLLKDLENLSSKSIFFINKQNINKIISNYSFIESYEVYKKYPSTLDIKIRKAVSLAKINQDGKLFIIGSNGKLLNDDLSNKHLPFVFGNPEVSDFLRLKYIIDASGISFDQVKNFYYFPSNRWDLELANNKIIKLSKKDIKENLDDVLEFFNNEKFKDTKIFDERIKNQIIINE